MKPDFIVLAGMGILPPSLISTAKAAVINVHPGLLPWVRGTGVVGAALLRGVPVGVTSHFVNAGVDLGDIIERRLLPVEGASSLVELEHRADELAISMLVDLVGRCIGGERFAPFAQTDRHPICRWLTPAERSQVERAIMEGQAKALFGRWTVYSDGAPTFRLRPDIIPPRV